MIILQRHFANRYDFKALLGKIFKMLHIGHAGISSVSVVIASYGNLCMKAHQILINKLLRIQSVQGRSKIDQINAIDTQLL